jgi:hypothetical protein
MPANVTYLFTTLKFKNVDYVVELIVIYFLLCFLEAANVLFLCSYIN